MFIYKITVVPLNQVYIGFDTHPSYKLKRWKEHCKNVSKQYKTKLYQAMRNYGIENCTIEILEDNFLSIIDLALAEIRYIKQYDSFNNGLNSTRGGDGMGRHLLHTISYDDLLKIKNALGVNFSEYNKQIKWANTTFNERKILTQHLHNEEVYSKKSNTLKKFYEANPAEKDKKKIGIVKWQIENQDLLRSNNRKNSLLGAAKVSKKISVETPSGDMLHFVSKSEFQRQTGQWAKTVIEKTKQGLSHNGYKAWENE
jgi:hypothetical protein